jgi:hypothetical protein
MSSAYDTRRAGLLDSELGSANLTLADATLDPLLPLPHATMSDDVVSMHVEVVIASYSGARIVRQSSSSSAVPHTHEPHGAFDSNPTWEESVQFRACLDWEVKFSLLLRNLEGIPITVLTSETMTIKALCAMHNHSMHSMHAYSARSYASIPLRMGAKLVGQLRISMTFFPNYGSFRYLTQL